jgi:hypothetical protein
MPYLDVLAHFRDTVRVCAMNRQGKNDRNMRSLTYPFETYEFVVRL